MNANSKRNLRPSLPELGVFLLMVILAIIAFGSIPTQEVSKKFLQPEPIAFELEHLVLENQAYREMLDEQETTTKELRHELELCQVKQDLGDLTVATEVHLSACVGEGPCYHDEWPASLVTTGTRFLYYPPGMNKHQDMMIQGLLMQINQAYPAPADVHHVPGSKAIWIK